MSDCKRERTDAVVSVIRALGFIGNSHYCPDCGNLFHHDRGQHTSECGFHAQTANKQEWKWWMNDWTETFK